MPARRLGEKLAAGRTADVHAWGATEVVKVYQPWMPADAARSERRRTAAAVALGLPVPRVGRVVCLGRRRGLVFQRLRGPTMMEALAASPPFEPWAERLADLHLSLHAGPVSHDLPAQHEVLARRLVHSPHLSAALRQAALDALARLPSGDRLCHGDFHPGNVLMTDAGEYVIDWVDASAGSPAADVARSLLLFAGHIATDPAPPGDRAATQRFRDAYLARYLARSSVSAQECRQWFPVLAAARLREGIPELRDWLLKQAHRGLGLRGG
ncbi:MAG: phosphotransferase [Candidatus Latescibacterota bacterium]